MGLCKLITTALIHAYPRTRRADNIPYYCIFVEIVILGSWRDRQRSAIHAQDFINFSSSAVPGLDDNIRKPLLYLGTGTASMDSSYVAERDPALGTTY